MTARSSKSVFLSVRVVALALLITAMSGCGGGGGSGSGGGSSANPFAGSFSGTASATSTRATTIEFAFTMQVSPQGVLTGKTTTPSGPGTLSGSVSNSGDATATITSGSDTVTLTGKFQAIPGGVTCSGTLTATDATGTWSGARYTGANPLAGSISGTATVQTPAGPDSDSISGTVSADGTMTLQVVSPGGTYPATGTCDVNGNACILVVIPSFANDYFYGTFTLQGSTLTGSGYHQLWSGGTAPSFTGNWSFTGQKT